MRPLETRNCLDVLPWRGVPESTNPAIRAISRNWRRARSEKLTLAKRSSISPSADSHSPSSAPVTRSGSAQSSSNPYSLVVIENVRSMPGEQFAELLSGDLEAAVVVVGHDFRFGRNGETTAPMLQQAGQRLGFAVDVVEPVHVDGERVSSSRIREALARGDLAQAERWLGRPYAMSGRVVEGAHLGRTLGFATANLRLERRRPALKGIFAVRVRGVAGCGSLPGVASLGTRPTVNGVEPLLEAHLFDFEGDLYGREIEVQFVAKLREEEHFATLDALVEQMHKDAAAARDVLKT